MTRPMVTPEDRTPERRRPDHDRRSEPRRVADRGPPRWQVPFRAIYAVASLILTGLLNLIGRIIDRIYSRFDLWSSHPTWAGHGGEPDYAKVRGFFLYITVVFIMVYLAITREELPSGFLTAVTLGLLAAAFGERTLLAFFKAWGARKVVDTGVIRKTMSPPPADAREPHIYTDDERGEDE